MKKVILLLMSGVLFGLFSCGKDNSGGDTPRQYNPSAYITDTAKLKMLHSIKNLVDGKLYEMDYSVDYKWDAFLKANVSSYSQFLYFVAANLFDSMSESLSMSIHSFGCSALAVKETGTNNYLMGRNYDYPYTDSTGNVQEIARILVRTAPEGKKRSIGIVDGMFLGCKQGFYEDGKTDLSLLMAAPYAMMDGINEDGLAIGVLFLDGNPAFQDTGKGYIWLVTLIRLVLDNAGTITEAEDLIKQFDLSMALTEKGSYHFFMADATGKYAIVECSYGESQSVETDKPNELKFFEGSDTCRYVTNFYVDPRMADEEIGGKSQHGRVRYEKMKSTLKVKSYSLTEQEVKNLLSEVSQVYNPPSTTSDTHWSSVYNLNKKTLELALHHDYSKWFSFSVK